MEIIIQSVSSNATVPKIEANGPQMVNNCNPNEAITAINNHLLEKIPSLYLERIICNLVTSNNTNVQNAIVH